MVCLLPWERSCSAQGGPRPPVRWRVSRGGLVGTAASRTADMTSRQAWTWAGLLLTALVLVGVEPGVGGAWPGAGGRPGNPDWVLLSASPAGLHARGRQTLPVKPRC